MESALLAMVLLTADRGQYREVVEFPDGAFCKRQMEIIKETYTSVIRAYWIEVHQEEAYYRLLAELNMCYRAYDELDWMWYTKDNWEAYCRSRSRLIKVIGTEAFGRREMPTYRLLEISR